MALNFPSEIEAQSGYRDYLGRYYTEQQISDLLISELEIDSVNSILDLGSGYGSLSNAASERWSNALILSLDIEERFYTDERIHITGNALDYNLPLHLGIKEGSVDLAVCNPPYIKASWNNDYLKVADSLGISRYISINKICTSELIFLVQMIRMLRVGGGAGIILPDSIFTAQKYQPFRNFLLEQHCVKKVIELPSNAFKKTEAKTHILIFSKGIIGKNSNSIELRRLELNGVMSGPIFIKKDEAVVRLDYSHHNTKKSHNNAKFKLSDVCSVLRGKQSSVEIKTMKQPTVHTTSFREPVPSLCLSGGDDLALLDKSKYLVAKPGDILLARVGRNHHRKIAYVHTGFAIVSDCFFVIRTSLEHAEYIYNFLVSDIGQSGLFALSYGVAAKQISKKQLLDFEC